MTDNIPNTNPEKNDNQNFYNDENGEEELGQNYEEEYEGEMEGEEQIDLNQEGEEGQEEEIEGGEEEAIDGGEEGEMLEGNEEEGEEHIEEQESNEKKISDNEQKIQNNLNFGFLDNYSKNLNSQINPNINNKNKNNIKKNELKNDFNFNYQNNNINNINNINNVINNENLIDDEIKNIKENKSSNKKNDILSELLGKIQDFKQNKMNIKPQKNTSSNKTLEELDNQLTSGLEKINNGIGMNNVKMENKIKEDQKMECNNQPINKKFLRNPRFKEIINMINEKKIKNVNYNKKITKNDLTNLMNNYKTDNRQKMNNYLSNIDLVIPKRNKYISNLTNAVNKTSNFCAKNNFKKYNDNKNYYISCIDGKAIINGLRKEIPIVTKYNISNYNNDKYSKKNDLFFDLYNTNNDYSFKTIGRQGKRDGSLNINRYCNKNDYDLNMNKINFRCRNNDYYFNKLKDNFYGKDNLTEKLNKIGNYTNICFK